MKTITFTEFRKNASGFMNEVEQGETLVVLRRGKPIAEIVPLTDDARQIPSWKQPVERLQVSGSLLSKAILDEREAGA